MKNVSDWLTSVSSGRLCLLTLIIFIAFVVLVLPGQSAQAEESTGGAGSPDLSLVYSVEDLYAMARSYGEVGRREYIKARFTFDLAWPIVYGAFLISAISWLVERVSRAGSPWRASNLIPVAGMVFDYLENVSASIVMARFPTESGLIAWLATVFTPIKWIFVGLGFAILMGAGVVYFWQRIKGDANSEV